MMRQSASAPELRPRTSVGTKRSMIPNLPGLRPGRVTARSLPQSLRVQYGYMMVRGQRPVTAPQQTPLALSPVREALDFHDLSGRYSIPSQQRDKASHMLPFNDEASLPSFLKYDRQVLCFKAYYKEPVNESAVENERVRKCLVYYYLEDDTMQMIEPPETNSGMPQGAFIRRHKIPKPQWQLVASGAGSPGCEADDDQEYYGVNDLYVGAELDVYKKKLVVYDCDAFTQQYIQQSVEPPGSPISDDASRVSALTLAPLECPEGAYDRMQRLRMQRETGADTSVKRNRIMHPMKAYMEAKLGKPQSVADLGSFLAHDRQVLRFDCVWDDSDRLYGDILKFKLHYFLSDDTVEILNERTNGRDHVPKLLSRRKLPLPSAQVFAKLDDGEASGRGTNKSCYHWTDLAIGSSLEVFKRRLVLVDADPFTRDYYARERRPLDAAVVVDDEPRGSVVDTPVPPYNGFGSDEDSLRSVYSIRPKKPTRDAAQSEQCALRFEARFLHPKPEDQSRLFVIIQSVPDAAIKIREPPQRNSGVLGGQFLGKTKYKHLRIGDLVVGARVAVAGHAFVIHNADEATLKFMEARAHQFPDCDADFVAHRFACYLNDAGGHLPPDDVVFSSFADFQACLGAFVPSLDAGGPPAQAALTLWRRHANDGALAVATLRNVLAAAA